jgi:mono/diheme cytochrome c family protein
MSRVFAASLAIAALIGMMPRLSSGQPAPAHDPGDEGKHVYQRANCVGCHKWHGGGGGGYGGAALSLRQTQLTREQIIETVSCGRPGTGMPFHLRGAYDTQPCYGLMRKDLDATMPPEGVVFLRPKEIELVADYVLTHIKGKGEPTYGECIAFFGEGSRVCNSYRSPSAPANQAPAGG